MEDHKIIFLEPRCDKVLEHNRMWCQDDVWGECECGCGAKATKYRIAADVANEIERAKT